MTTYFALGLMSGTSLDGLDLCHVKFSLHHKTWHFEILESETLPYPESWAKKLAKAINLPAVDLLELHVDYGFF